MSLSLLAAAALLSLAPAAFAYTAIYGFGDSLTDTGNNPAPLVGYFHGRYSNGPLWIEYLSTNLGLAYNPSNNFAVSGSQTSDLAAQIAGFQPGTNVATGLFVVWSGNNDFIDNADKALNDSFWNSQIALSVSNLVQAVNLLYAKGARNILVPNEVDLSKLPAFITVLGPFGSLGVAYVQAKVAQFNNLLTSDLQAFQVGKTDLHFYLMDIKSKLDAAAGQPTAYGFTKIDVGALSDPGLTDKSFDGPGKNYLFWDPIHPTTRAHAIVAQWMMETLGIAVQPRLQLLSVGGQLHLSGGNLEPSKAYVLQSSPDLVNWSNAPAWTPTDLVQSVDLPAGQSSAAIAFFRLLSTK